MGKKNAKPVAAPAPRKNSVDITIRRKAKKVIQSNGIPFFLKWAEEQYSGGSRRKASRPSLKTVNSKLMNQLVEKYRKKNRKMDQPKEDA